MSIRCPSDVHQMPIRYPSTSNHLRHAGAIWKLEGRRRDDVRFGERRRLELRRGCARERGAAISDRRRRRRWPAAFRIHDCTLQACCREWESSWEVQHAARGGESWLGLRQLR